MNIKHLQGPYKHIFMNEDEISEALRQMEEDASLKTNPSYERDTPESLQMISFREKHAAYLKSHPKVNPEYYLSNLRTMLKIRP